MGLHKRKEIPELYELKHRNDKLANPSYDIENNILKRSLSTHMYSNPNLSGYLERLQPLLYVIINKMYIMKNLKNFMVDKYYDNHAD